MKNDLGRRPYKKVIEPLLSNDQKIKRKNGVRTNFGKEDTMTILFSDQTLMVSTNCENDRVIVLMPIKKVALSRDRKECFLFQGHNAFAHSR